MCVLFANSMVCVYYVYTAWYVCIMCIQRGMCVLSSYSLVCEYYLHIAWYVSIICIQHGMCVLCEYSMICVYYGIQHGMYYLQTVRCADKKHT